MSEQAEWKVLFYHTPGGTSPVEEFLESLDEKTQTRFAWAIEQLRVRNTQAGEPLVRHIEGKIWELRRESNTNIYRLFYFFSTERRIVFLHGFQKKTKKTPGREIDIALARLEDYIKRKGGESE